MIRKLTVVLLVAVMCLVGATPVLGQEIWSTLPEYEEVTGNKIEKFNESPMLRTKVAAGELPSLDERLPEDILVVEPLEEIGQYGGTAHVFTERVSPGDAMFMMGQLPILRLAPDCVTIVPNIAKKWDLSKDGKTLTLHFRKGMKWSDGFPFTADDIMFWWEDVILNDELTPTKPLIWTPGGELMRVEKLDDYTVRLSFSVPYPTSILVLACYYNVYITMPKHYLEQFHIKYNPKANELAKENGFKAWYMYFLDRNEVDHSVPVNPDLPTVAPFRLAERTTEYWLYERNPYYWMVDTAGNQLPYIDKILSRKVSNVEVYNAKIVSGETDYAIRITSLENYPLYQESAEKGNYRVLPWKVGYTSILDYLPNQTCKDPVLRKIFQDVRFRRAISLAINREEISGTIFFGLATPVQVSPFPLSDYYEERFAKSYTEFSPDKANALLDEIGLTWDKNHKYRLRSDGETLMWVVLYTPHLAYGTAGAINELVREYWKKIGCKVIMKEQAQEVINERIGTNEIQMSTTWADMCTNSVIWRPEHFVFHQVNPRAVEWGRWFQTKGKLGEEPPEEVKKNVERWERMRTTLDNDERIRLGKEIAASQAENLWEIGTVGDILKPVIARNNLRNIPEESIYTGDFLDTTPSLPETYFFAQK